MAYITSRDPDEPFFLVFTDLDGTLLDHRTYSFEDALPAVEYCQRAHVPMILVSSKTRAEMDPLRSRLGLSDPFVTENGGGVFFPREAFKTQPEGALPVDEKGVNVIPLAHSAGLWEWSLGEPYSRLIQALSEIRNELGWKLKGFSDMRLSEIVALTGLDEMSAKLAKMREFDEPFVIEGNTPADLAPLHECAKARGFRVTSGGRFYHLMGNNHKGTALMRIADWYREKISIKGKTRKLYTIALGDSPNDFPMLSAADFPVLIRSDRHFPNLKKRIPKITVTAQTGPKGWSEAVLNILTQQQGEGQ